MQKLLKPTNDYVFKRLFGKKGNENITKKLLECIIGEEYTNINLSSNSFIEQEKIADKFGILDVRATTKTEEIDIEMQVASQEYIIDRILWYTSGMYFKSIKKGENFENTKRAVTILFSVNGVKGLEKEPMHSVYNFVSKNTHDILTLKQEIHIIQIDKLRDVKELDELAYWVKFLISPEQMEESIMDKYEGIKEAKEELEDISQDEMEARIAEMREYAQMNEASALSSAERKGKKEEKIRTAKALKEMGIDIDTIVKATELSKEEIEKL